MNRTPLIDRIERLVREALALVRHANAVVFVDGFEVAIRHDGVKWVALRALKEPTKLGEQRVVDDVV
jgi:hypothetical protein